jgi:hypothetical protein
MRRSRAITMSCRPQKKGPLGQLAASFAGRVEDKGKLVLGARPRGHARERYPEGVHNRGQEMDEGIAEAFRHGTCANCLPTAGWRRRGTARC